MSLVAGLGYPSDWTNLWLWQFLCQGRRCRDCVARGVHRRLFGHEAYYRPGGRPLPHKLNDRGAITFRDRLAPMGYGALAIPTSARLGLPENSRAAGSRNYVSEVPSWLGALITSCETSVQRLDIRLQRHSAERFDAARTPRMDYFLESSFAPSGRNSPEGETWRYNVCRVSPSSLQRAPTFVSF